MTYHDGIELFPRIQGQVNTKKLTLERLKED